MAQPIRPMLGDLELQQVQMIQFDEDQVLTRHDVPGLEGDFFQRLGRAGAAIKLSGIQSGTEAREGLNGLREVFRAGDPLTFAADIVTATALDRVLIDRFEIAEHAGLPDAFEYRLRLREYTEPETPETEVPPPPPPPPPVEDDEGVLVVTVIKENDPGFDPSTVTVQVTGTDAEGNDVDRPMTNREDNRWTEDPFPVGSFTVVANAVGAGAVGGDLSGSEPAVVRAGETTEVTIVLRDGAAVALCFLIHFRFDSAFIEPCLKQVLRQVADFASSNGHMKLLTVGHTDLTGSTAYNQSLSERRARSAFAMLRFGNDRQAAIDEWNELRKARTVGTTRSLRDTWGAREYQQMLQDRGFYTGRIDGDHGPMTDTAVRAFQSANGLTETGALDDATWPVLIEAYLAAENLSVPDGQFLPNCPGEILKWLGCSELDPVRDTEDAWRPNRRTELLFTRADVLPADMAEPDTFNLPAAGAVAGGWCVNDSGTTTRCCFTARYAGIRPKETCPAPPPRGPALTRQPAEPSPSFVVRGTIRFEDGTPYTGTFFVTASDGEYMSGERAVTSGGERAGTPFRDTPDAIGAFSYPDKPKTPGVLILELDADVLARPAGAPLEQAKGPVVCTRLASDGDSFDVVIVDRAVAGIVPSITAPAAVVVRKPQTNPARQPVVLSVNTAVTGTGTLTISQGAGRIRIFDAAAAGAELAFDGTDNVFTSDQLLAGHTVFVEGGPDPSLAANDVELSLALTVNGQPGFTDREQTTSVRLTLDICADRVAPGVEPVPLTEAGKVNPGRFLQVQNAAFQARRAMLIVRRAEPEDFAGNLVLTPIGGQVRLFAEADEVAAAGQAVLAPPPLSFDHATVPRRTPPPNLAGLRFWVEAGAISARARDTGFQLGLDGIEPDGDRVSVTAVQCDFVSQANAAFPFTGNDACMMVSKFVTDVNLPDTATFDGPPGAAPDPDTFRMQVTGLPAGQPLQLRLQTLRGGVQQTDHTFAIVEGAVGGGPAYRTDEHIRLVSNAVDDAHRAHQTALVRLEDTVRATALLSGTEIARIELPVGRPPAEAGPKAVRTCDIHFVTFAGTNSDPAFTIQRMNEDWAQIAIRFNLLSSETVTPVRNVLTVSGAATAAGNVTFNMTNAAGTAAAVVVPIAAGDNAQAIAGKIAARISAVAGFAATEHSHLAQRIVLVNPRQNVDFDAIVSPEAAVVVQEPALDFTDEINLLEGNLLGLNFDDGNDSSIDMIAVGQIDMRLNPGDSAARAVTGNDASAATLAGWQNLSILTENAVNRINDATVNPTGDDARLPFTAGHEMGHAIFDGGNGIHHPTATNLFTGGGTSTADTIGASKRLDDPQNTRGRDRSGPATVPPLLQQR